jgi:hypothetical protein
MTILQTVGMTQFGLILFIMLIIAIAVVDILRNEFTGSNKLIWIFTVVLIPGLGVILYYLIGVKQKLKKS